MTSITNLKEFKDIHNNKTAILIGSGPSLKKGKKYFDYATKKKYLFFGNNNSIFEKFLFKLHYFVISDEKSFRKVNKKKYIKATVKKEKFFVSNKEREKKILTKEELKKSKGKSFDMSNNKILKRIKKEFVNGSSLLITFQLILLMGIKKIYLAGCDCGGDTNFYLTKKIRDYTHLINRWKYLKEYTKKYYPDVKIYVINPVNLKDVFPEDPNYFKS